MADNDKDLKLKVEKNDENNPEYREYHVKKAVICKIAVFFVMLFTGTIFSLILPLRTMRFLNMIIPTVRHKKMRNRRKALGMRNRRTTQIILRKKRLRQQSRHSREKSSVRYMFWKTVLMRIIHF